MVEDNESLEPRRFNQPVTIVARHIERYLAAVKLLDSEDRSGLTVLDYGCGSGYGTSLLYEFYNKAVGYDPNPVQQQGVNRTNVLLLAALPDYKFDIVFCIEVIEHVSKQEAKQMLEDLKCLAWSSIVISTPIAAKPTDNPSNPHHKHEYSLQELMSLFDCAKLAVVASEIKSTTFTDGETKGQGLFILKRLP